MGTAQPCHIERYLTVVSQSLTSDAPGWSAGTQLEAPGPTCWKCKGLGHQKVKVSIGKTNCPPDLQISDGQMENQILQCRVCHGDKYLRPKQKDGESRNGSIPGKITSKRRAPHGWKDLGPPAFAVEEMRKYIKSTPFDLTEISSSSYAHHPLYLLYLATHNTTSDPEGSHHITTR